VAGDWPTYAYIPGRGPHPFKHPDGHGMVGEPNAVPGVACMEQPAFWRALALADRGYLWEAHELWERVWRLERHQGIQGLIQAVAAVLRFRAGDRSAARKLGDRAIPRMASLPPEVREVTEIVLKRVGFYATRPEEA